MDALTEAVIAACDPLDGVTDGLISDAEACSFDPFSMVGKVVNCTATGEEVTISEASADIANLTWTGPRKANGDFLWYGVDYQARLTGSDNPSGTTSDLGYAATTCSSNGTCVGAPTGLGEGWLKYFVRKDPEWNYTQIDSVDEYARMFHASVQQFDSIIGTSDADLSGYRDAGGKLITYHGLVSSQARDMWSPLSQSRHPIRYHTNIGQCNRLMVSSQPEEPATTTTEPRRRRLISRTSSVTLRFQDWHTAQVGQEGSLRRHSRRLWTGSRKGSSQRRFRLLSTTHPGRSTIGYCALTQRRRALFLIPWT